MFFWLKHLTEDPMLFSQLFVRVTLKCSDAILQAKKVFVVVRLAFSHDFQSVGSFELNKHLPSPKISFKLVDLSFFLLVVLVPVLLALLPVHLFEHFLSLLDFQLVLLLHLPLLFLVLVHLLPLLHFSFSSFLVFLDLLLSPLLLTLLIFGELHTQTNNLHTTQTSFDFIMRKSFRVEPDWLLWISVFRLLYQHNIVFYLFLFLFFDWRIVRCSIYARLKLFPMRARRTGYSNIWYVKLALILPIFSYSHAFNISKSLSFVWFILFSIA